MMMLETTATAVQIGTNKNLSGYRAALFACFLCVGVLTQLRLVTRGQIDGLTDRRTHDDSIHHRAIIAHAVRSNKKWSKSKNYCTWRPTPRFLVCEGSRRRNLLCSVGRICEAGGF